MRFELACLRELGLMPVLDRCAQCGAAVESPVGGRIVRAWRAAGSCVRRCRPGMTHVARPIGQGP